MAESTRTSASKASRPWSEPARARLMATSPRSPSVPEKTSPKPPPPRRRALSQPPVAASSSETSYSKTGAEPELTNFARTAHQAEVFAATLDYIWLSRGQWRVREVRPLPSRAEVELENASFPSASEPSDHLLISAELELV